jgi:hypothetical protein
MMATTINRNEMMDVVLVVILFFLMIFVSRETILFFLGHVVLGQRDHAAHCAKIH